MMLQKKPLRQWVLTSLILLILLWPFLAAAQQVIKATDILLPESLGKIHARIDGPESQPLVLIIGESHVSLKVQQAVADTLSYLHAAYGMDLVCSEGFSNPLPSVAGKASIIATRISAQADLVGRRISAVEYIARAYPDIRVIGIEDMKAKKVHEQSLSQGTKDAQQWVSDFQRFVQEDLGQLQVNEADGERVVAAFNKFVETKEIGGFANSILEVVGRDSSVGRKLTALVARREAIENVGSNVDENDPLMKNRDAAMVARTLVAARKSRLTALVIGKLHIPGIERELKAKKKSYVTILVAGVDEEKEADATKDSEIYEQWTKGEKTPFEEWLSKLKPDPAALRATFQNRTAILNGLVNADLMLRQGSSLEDIQRITDGAKLSPGFRIMTVSQGAGGGSLIEFTFNGKRAYATFDVEFGKTENDSQLRILEEGQSGGRHYTIYEGGSGGKPPTPPSRTPPSGPDPPKGNGPGGNFHNIFLAAVQKQKQLNPEAVAVAFFAEDGMLKRQVGKNIKDLGISLMEAKEQAERFEKSAVDPEGFRAAHKLAESLLIGLDDDLPPNMSRLYHISEGDFLQNIALSDLARLAQPSGTARLQAMREDYNVPRQSQEDLIDILSQVPPPVDIRKTVVLVADPLRTLPQYQSTLDAMISAGALVNETPPSGATLILLGAPSENWSATLKNDAILSSNSPEFQKIIQEAESVVSINTSLSDSSAAMAKQIHRRQVDDQHVLQTGQKTIEDIKNGSGKEPIDRVTRKSAREESQKLRELFTKKPTQEALSRAASSTIGLNQHPSRRQRG